MILQFAKSEFAEEEADLDDDDSTPPHARAAGSSNSSSKPAAPTNSDQGDEESHSSGGDDEEGRQRDAGGGGGDDEEERKEDFVDPGGGGGSDDGDDMQEDEGDGGDDGVDKKEDDSEEELNGDSGDDGTAQESDALFVELHKLIAGIKLNCVDTQMLLHCSSEVERTKLFLALQYLRAQTKLMLQPCGLTKKTAAKQLNKAMTAAGVTRPEREVHDLYRIATCFSRVNSNPLSRHASVVEFISILYAVADHASGASAAASIRKWPYVHEQSQRCLKALMGLSHFRNAIEHSRWNKDAKTLTALIHAFLKAELHSGSERDITGFLGGLEGQLHAAHICAVRSSFGSLISRSSDL